MTPNERRSFVHQMRYCLNCLASSHERERCKSSLRCMFCDKNHHSMLHSRANSPLPPFPTRRTHRNSDQGPAPRFRNVGVQTPLRHVRDVGVQNSQRELLENVDDAVNFLQRVRIVLCDVERAIDSLQQVRYMLR